MASLLATPPRSGPGKAPQYVPPDVASASESNYPVNTLAAGSVILLSLDSNAQIQNIQVCEILHL